MKAAIIAAVAVAFAPATLGTAIALFADPIYLVIAARSSCAAPSPSPSVSALPDASKTPEVTDDPGTAVACRAAGGDSPWPDRRTIDEGGGLSPLGYYYRECTDFVAWRLNRDAGASTAPWEYTWVRLTPLGGDAIDWKKNWISHGWGVSGIPTVGWVAWWGIKGGPQGHVAYVQAAYPDGTITVEEYNWGGKHSYDTRTIPYDAPDAGHAPPPAGGSA